MPRTLETRVKYALLKLKTQSVSQNSKFKNLGQMYVWPDV